MRKLLIVLCLLVSVYSAQAQYYYQDAKNSEMLRHADRHAPARKLILIPQVNGYNVYKADLHTHTVFSDGHVVPHFRVNEAWRDGLDIMAVTEHIEYRPIEKKFYKYLENYAGEPYKSKIDKVDLNFVVKESIAEGKKYGLTIIPGVEITRNGAEIGHFNALFTTDNNLIYHPDPVQAIRNAKAQGAMVMHNHPGWLRDNIDFTPTEAAAYAEDLIDGVEVMNETEFYPGVIDRVRERGLFIAANTDIHTSTSGDYRLYGLDRPMTLILAKDKSLESVREALENRRTIAYGFNTICGEMQLLTDLFNACVKVEKIDGDADRSVLMLTNQSSIQFLIKREGTNQLHLDPLSVVKITLSDGEKTLDFTVLNAWTGEQEHLKVSMTF